MRNLLVVVDMQNDFIDGSLGTKEAVAIVDNVIAEIAKYDTKDIFATRDSGRKKSSGCTLCEGNRRLADQ